MSTPLRSATSMIVSPAAAASSDAVQPEGDRLLRYRVRAARSSSLTFAARAGSSLITTHAIGFGAACPSPQIDASIIACDKLVEQRRVPLRARHQRDRLFGAHAARRALAAGLVGEELHQVERRVARAVVLRQHDHRRRADEAAVRLQRVEIERDVAERSRQDAARRAARQVAVERRDRAACRRSTRRSARAR